MSMNFLLLNVVAGRGKAADRLDAREETLSSKIESRSMEDATTKTITPRKHCFVEMNNVSSLQQSNVERMLNSVFLSALALHYCITSISINCTEKKKKEDEKEKWGERVKRDNI